ncbi:MAG: hypothetical protein ACK5NB_09465 [Flavobacteriaceae bacterium]
MKRLKLQKLRLDSSNLIERNQLKSIFGGYGGGDMKRREVANLEG